MFGCNWRQGRTSFSVLRGGAFIAVLWLAAVIQPCLAKSPGWPAFRGDAQRSGLSPETLALPLAPAWTYQPAQPPSPAWPAPALTNYAILYGPLQQTLNFDAAFHVVADAESVYFGSSSEDAVFCLDAATGRERWRFVTQGPVRLPPALHKGMLLAGSDDGHLYALDARTGKLRWKYRAGDADKRLPGNGRMISLWPVRCGIVADGDLVYFTAGLFPTHGVYLCAVKADTGRQVFKRALNFAAQGTMLASADQLFVATGRTAFWGCDRKDGRPLVRYGSSDPWKTNLVGGSFALLVDGALATGPSEDGQFHWFNLWRKTPSFRSHANAMLAREDRVYVLGKGRLSALDRAAYLGDQKPRKEPVPLWSAAAGQAATMIGVGDKLVAGGPGEIAVFETADGTKSWSATIPGAVEGLAFCQGRLYASLDNGQTICFQSGLAAASTGTPAPAPDAVKPFPDNPLLARAAEAALSNAGVTKGYCLVLQAGTGQLAYEIAKRSEFRVVCHEENPAKFEALREKLLKTGWYGRRIEAHQGSAKALPYPKYFANLIVAEGVLTEGASLPAADQVLRVLRPYGGTAHLMAAADAKLARQLAKWGQELPDWRVTTNELVHGVARRGAPPGGGEWSHFYGDPGNTACSGDEIRSGPMELQWFGPPGPHEMVDRHKKGPAPLFVNGRLFIPGFNYLAALDAYNGYILWEQRIPQSVRVAAFKDSSSIVATDSQVLVAAADACLVLDAQTGELRRRIPLAGAATNRAWGYLAAAEGLIIGSVAQAAGSLRTQTKLDDKIIWRNDQPVVCSSSVFAVDRATGQAVWQYAAGSGALINPTFAIGNGRLYFVESANRQTLASPDGRIRLADLLGQGAKITALDLKTGVPIWVRDHDLTALQQVIYLSYAKETVLLSGSRYVTVTPEETKGLPKPTQLKRIRYDLLAFDARTGDPKWNVTATPNYDYVLDGGHGEQVQHPAIVDEIIYGPDFAFHLQTGRPYEGWKWKKSHKCATLSTSRYCAFSRFTDAKLPYIFDLQSGKSEPLTTATRPGCWINTIPAGGLILIPEASAGCTCEYAIQTSLALAPAD